jgi:hypothetical protein
MAQNDKPLFPRDLEGDSEAQSLLREHVKQKLEDAESESGLEFPPLKNDLMSPPVAPAYGPPPMPIRILSFLPFVIGAIIGLLLIAVLSFFLFRFLF